MTPAQAAAIQAVVFVTALGHAVYYGRRAVQAARERRGKVEG